MSFMALNNATDSFDKHNLIGFGKKGKLYKARIPYDRLAAVKRNFEPKISNFGGAIVFSKRQDFYMPKETVKERISHPSTTIDTLYRVVDKSLIGRGDDAKIFGLLDIARNCVEPLPDERPTMLQVYKMLIDVKKINNGFED
ncbi:hypothetical protein GH714_008899 [Hevea brasiliensis]|uniref:Serine-threonine/tyrosine-protein kinase catalytic domain-containing protein n=1 Tax=Hevea brasiliensis TaxID=3981 RepID=A0A6A6MV64_HEVBR|nr:hypothetical protein GH714_008899 [Hevea brasiliensis]